MANYVRAGYRAIPELHSKRLGDGRFTTTVRLYQYPGELREIEKMEFTKETELEAKKAAVAWVTQNMARFKG
jgi:hypothetical protein